MSTAPVSAAPQGLVGGPSAPAIAGFNDKIYMAFVNGSSGERIAITSSTDGGATFGNLVELPDKTSTTAALATFDGRLYIAWLGTSKPHQLNVESSADGVNWGDKVTLPETSIAGPGWPDPTDASTSAGQGPIPPTNSTSSRQPMA